jgi:hypothetical protein
MTNYTKTMGEVLESMYVSEDNVGILRDIVKRKQAKPLKFADGKMKVDLFTASAVTQALDKVNPANKAKITKLINTGKKGSFIKIAQVVMKSENDPEVEEENEGFASDAQRRAAFASGYKEKGKKKDKKEDVGLDENKLLDALKKKLSDEGGAAGFKDLEDTAKKMDVDLTPDMLKKMSGIKQHKDGDYILEETDLDEAMLKGRDYEYDEKEGVVKISKKNFAKVKKDYKGTDKSKPTMMVLTKKGTSLVPVKFTEEVELDENKDVRKKYKGKEQKAVDMMIMRNGVDSVQKTHDKDPKKFDAMVKRMSKNIKEEVELDEKKAKVLSIEFRSSADVKKARKWMDQNLPGADQGFTGVDYRVKSIQFEDVDDAEGLMSKLKKAGFKFKVDYREEVEESYEYGTDEYAKHTRDVTPGQEKEIDEARPSARRDAMRDMGKRGKDSADVDDYKATADDRKAADKNIIMQLRKATNLGGKYEVEFKDKKKVKVKPAIAMAFIKKFEKMKPVDKAKLQDKGSKSYRDLLKGLKEEDTSKLGRIERKLKEIRNG